MDKRHDPTARRWSVLRRIKVASPPARSRPRVDASASGSLPVWAAVCFFVSGAAGLLYEVVWAKQLAYLLGNSLQAVATVVAAFLGGLAIGARVLGVPLARRGQGVRVYALLELGIAAMGLISLPILRGLDPLVGSLYRTLGGEGVAFGLARFALLSALLMPPAALMGATLPVLVARFERELVGPALARLYALNTFGAVAGTVTGGFALLPGIGLLATTWVAAALNLSAAAWAWLASGRSASVAAPARPPPARRKSGGRRLPPRDRLWLSICFGLSGFAALAFQIAWVRLFGLVFGSSVYSFAAVLGIYLMGLALGSAGAAAFIGRGVGLATFGRLQLAITVAAAAALYAFPRLPEWFYTLIERAGQSWPALVAGEVGLVALLLLIPCGLLGAVFPIATRLLQARDGGHAAGFAYAVNTLGTIAGSVTAGFLMVPRLGVAGTHMAALLVSLAIGLLVLLMAQSGRRASRADAVVAVAAVAAAGLAWAAPRWDPSLMSAGLFRPVEARAVADRARQHGEEGPTIWRGTRMERVLYYREGPNGSVLVGTNGASGSRWLRVGGKVEASSTDMETQVILGLIPAACADSGARSLVIGLGSGATLAAVLAVGAGPTEVVELEPAVVEASRFFHEPGEDPLRDPRVRLIVGDARTHLAYGRDRYGLIVSEPSNPWMAGINNLFTVDFYRLAKARLEPGGVFCQWLQLYELAPETFASLAASFLSVFPEGHVFAAWTGNDALLVAAPNSAHIDLERLRRPAAWRMLRQAGFASAEELAGNYAGPFAALRKDAALNRDDRPIVEYRAPRDLVATGTGAARHAASLLPFAMSKPAGSLYDDWPEEQWHEARGYYLLKRGDIDRALLAARAAEAAGFGSLGERLRAEVDARQSRNRVLAAVHQARQASEAGRTAEALQILERSARADGADPYAWVALADQYRLAGRAAEAESSLALAAASQEPDVRAQASMVLGMIERSRSRPAAAAALFRDAQRWMPDKSLPYVLEARALAEAGDMGAALEVVARGLAALPADPELLRVKAELEGAR